MCHGQYDIGFFFCHVQTTLFHDCAAWYLTSHNEPLVGANRGYYKNCQMFHWQHPKWHVQSTTALEQVNLLGWNILYVRYPTLMFFSVHMSWQSKNSGTYIGLCFPGQLTWSGKKLHFSISLLFYLNALLLTLCLTFMFPFSHSNQEAPLRQKTIYFLRETWCES